MSGVCLVVVCCFGVYGEEKNWIGWVVCVLSRLFVWCVLGVVCFVVVVSSSCVVGILWTNFVEEVCDNIFVCPRLCLCSVLAWGMVVAIPLVGLVVAESSGREAIVGEWCLG